MRALSLLAGIGTAQTVTVAKTGAAFTTISDAIDHFASDTDPTANVIQITDSSVYDEVITITAPITIEGTATVKPILAVQANASGREGSSGLVVRLDSSLSTGSVFLKNLAVIPSRTATPQSAGINVFNNNAYVEFEDVLLTANDGNDAPVSTDGKVNVPESASYTYFGDDGIVAGETGSGRFEGDGVEVLLSNTIVTSLRDSTANAATNALTNGVVMANPAGANSRLLVVKDGTVVSHSGNLIAPAYGFNVAGDFILDAPEKRVLLTGNQLGIFFNGNSPNVRSLNGVNILDNAYAGITEISTGGQRMTLENAIFSGQTRQNIWFAGAASSPATVRNVTFNPSLSSSYNTIRVESTAGSDITLENCIVTGNANQTAANIIYNNGTGNITLNNTALVTSGGLALSYTPGPTPFLKPELVVGQSVTPANPLLVNITDPESPFYFAVSSPYYADLGPGGTPLIGGGSYYAPSQSETVTVAKTGGDFTTIQAAIDSLTLDLDKKYTVRILDSAVYDEVLTIDVPLTLEGASDTARPVLAVRANSLGYDSYGSAAGNANVWAGDSGLLIALPHDDVYLGHVTLKNLIVIPSKTGTPPATGIANKANNVFIDIENVLVTGNNGNDEPISTTGLVDVAAQPAHVYYGGSAMYFGSIGYDRPEASGTEVRLRNTISTNNKIPGENADAPLLFRSGFHMPQPHFVPPGSTGTPRSATAHRHVTIEDGCIFSYNITGAYFHNSVSVIAPNQRVLFLGNRLAGMQIAGQFGSYFEGMIVAQNTNIGISENITFGPRMHLKNVIVADNGWDSLNLYNGVASQRGAILENVTLANQSRTPTTLPMPPAQQTNRYAILLSGGSSGSNTVIKMTAIDSIIAGHGITSRANNVVYLSAQAPESEFNLENTAVVTAGNRALNTVDGPIRTLTTVVNGSPITGADPMFINTTDPLHEDYYAVSNAAYDGLASTGSRLIGGGRDVTLTNVADWSMY